MLKYAVYCLGFRMLQLSNCCLEDLKTWSNCNIGWEGIPLDNGQWKEGVFIAVISRMNLTECHRMAIPGDTMCGRHVVRYGHEHQAIYNFIEEAETDHSLALFKGPPIQLPVKLRLSIYLSIFIFCHNNNNNIYLSSYFSRTF